MDRSHVLGMVCGYYLSRFDDIAYRNLGYSTQRRTHDELGRALGVAPESIKNWRDEFDPIHENRRKGWHRREMYPSRRRAIEALCDLQEGELLSLVRTIIAAPDGDDATTLLIALAAEDDSSPYRDGVGYSLRGQTGVRAEQAFIEFHRTYNLPIPGILSDRRHDQCGFDFEIDNEGSRAFVEVKGLATESGGITLTDKEWSTAQKEGDNYYIALVRYAVSEPTVSLVRNPAAALDPSMRIYTVLRVEWSVSQSRLRSATADEGNTSDYRR